MDQHLLHGSQLHLDHYPHSSILTSAYSAQRFWSHPEVSLPESTWGAVLPSVPLQLSDLCASELQLWPWEVLGLF